MVEFLITRSGFPVEIGGRNPVGKGQPVVTQQEKLAAIKNGLLAGMGHPKLMGGPDIQTRTVVGEGLHFPVNDPARNVSDKKQALIVAPEACSGPEELARDVSGNGDHGILFSCGLGVP